MIVRFFSTALQKYTEQVLNEDRDIWTIMKQETVVS